MYRGHQVEAGSTDVAGLDTVDSLDLSEQMVVVGDRLAAEGERTDGKIFVLAGETFLDGASENGLVACGRHLVVIGQAGRVLVDGAGHAERLRLARHQLGEIALASRDCLRHYDGGVVCRARHHALDRVFDDECAAGLEAQFGRRLSRGFARDLERTVELELAGLDLLEEQVEGHDFGERGGMPSCVRIGGMQDGAGIRVDDDVGVRRRLGGIIG